MTRIFALLPPIVALVACDPTPQPDPDPEPFGECSPDHDSARVPFAEIDGDTLIATVEHSGCSEAEITPCWDGAFLESFPVQVDLDLSIGEPQFCDAYFVFETEVDLTPLREAYEDAYGTSGGSILIGLADTSVLYEF